MAKKNKTSKAKKTDFNSDPFGNLKGFVISDLDKNEPQIVSAKPPQREVIGSFSDEMERLGVSKLSQDSETDTGASDCWLPVMTTGEDQTEEELFLEAMGDLTVNFQDNFPTEDSPPAAMPKRMKQLRQGRLVPEAALDLHGIQCAEVVEKLRHFLQNSQHHGWLTLLVITGKGLHSETGEAVLRNEVERFLSSEGQKFVTEWGRAPKKYGGEGALVLFLRKNCN